MRGYTQKERLTVQPVMTLEQIADIMGMSRERVRQIEASALGKCHKILRKKGYSPEDFFSALKYTKPIKHNPDAPDSEFELLDPEREEEDERN